MEKVVLASNNLHKVKEFNEILKNKEILTLKDVGFNEDIIEDGNSFLENALIKAKTVSNFLKAKGIEYSVLADDSGLVVNALNGEPGIYSARYAGESATDKQNRDKLLKNLQGKSDKSAYFNCVIVKYFPTGEYIYGEGKTYGEILDKEVGYTGFGYDCIFYSNDLKKSFGIALPEEKNSVSHRNRAIEDLLKKELKYK